MFRSPFTESPTPEDLTRTSLCLRVELLESELGTLRQELGRDYLTGLGNRRALESRSDGRGGWFVLADLDGFKGAQDKHPDGHHYGDSVLREFAAFLLRTVRLDARENGDAPDRVAARVGGDEFALWTSSKEGAQAIKTRIREWSSECGRVRASAGMGRNMLEADGALYVNKSDRKGETLSSRVAA